MSTSGHVHGCVLMRAGTQGQCSYLKKEQGPGEGWRVRDHTSSPFLFSRSPKGLRHVLSCLLELQAGVGTLSYERGKQKAHSFREGPHWIRILRLGCCEEWRRGPHLKNPPSHSQSLGNKALPKRPAQNAGAKFERVLDSGEKPWTFVC